MPSVSGVGTTFAGVDDMESHFEFDMGVQEMRAHLLSLGMEEVRKAPFHDEKRVTSRGAWADNTGATIEGHIRDPGSWLDLSTWYEDRDVDLESILRPELRWLCLSGNRKVTEETVVRICEEIRQGRLDLLWLGLKGTSFDASPYLENIADDVDCWRRPGENRRLEERFGLQRWMTMGRPPEREGREMIDPRTHPTGWPRRDVPEVEELAWIDEVAE